MTDSVVIERRFNGPPGSGHGGYVCGLVAAPIEGAAEVTLRSPPPLDRVLALERPGDGTVRLLDGEDVVAEGRPAALDIEVPEPPTLGEAEKAARRYPGFDDIPYPTCFGCGPDRRPEDGLRIFSGPVAGRALVAAPWAPHPSLADDSGEVGPEMIWAALDCPSGWAVMDLKAEAFPPASLILLGRFTAEVERGLEPGRRCVVMAWPIGRDGRKLYGGSAVFSEDGALWGKGRATWIVLESRA